MRGVLLTQDISRMRTEKVKQEEEANSRVIARSNIIGNKFRVQGTKGKYDTPCSVSRVARLYSAASFEPIRLLVVWAVSYI